MRSGPQLLSFHAFVSSTWSYLLFLSNTRLNSEIVELGVRIGIIQKDSVALQALASQVSNATSELHCQNGTQLTCLCFHFLQVVQRLGGSTSRHSYAAAFEAALDMHLSFGSGAVDTLVQNGLLPVSSRNLRRYFPPPHSTDGTLSLALRNFLRLAAQSSSVMALGNLRLIPCAVAADGIALARNLGYDPHTNLVCGTIPATTLDAVKQVLANDCVSDWEQGLVWADTAVVHVATTLCGEVTSPIAAFYTRKSTDASTVSSNLVVALEMQSTLIF
tara:strand:- start:823 stop:1647 length:825 start_codon:yes stop_codon:yes gene_type:complete